jgi:hypothetical protein
MACGVLLIEGITGYELFEEGSNMAFEWNIEVTNILTV